MVTDEVATTTDTLAEPTAPENHSPASEAHPAHAQEPAPAEEPAPHVADVPEEATEVEEPEAAPEPAVEEAEDEPVEANEDAAPELAPVLAEEPAKPNNKRWYIVKVQSGREETIRQAILRKVKIEGLEEYFGRIYIPTEKVTEMRNSKRYTREKKTLPGYFMAEVEFNDRILYLFRETSGVGDFVGGTATKPPQPMADHEVKRWLLEKKEGVEEEKSVVQCDFENGDRVKVKDGMFKDMEGEVKEIIEAKNQLSVELTVFGRPMKVELEYWQVERV